MTEKQTATVALVGNPNTGKSTLFTALAGVRQRVGNYPGVTVEKKVGRLRVDGRDLSIVDLPGTYSLAPRSPDEMIAVDVLLGRRDDVAMPDVILCIVDAANLQRNLYLVCQLLELGRPLIVALNMLDLARKRGMAIDVDRLRRQLGVPVVGMCAHRKEGLDELRHTLVDTLVKKPVGPRCQFPRAFEDEVTVLERSITESTGRSFPRFLVQRLLLDTGGYLEQSNWNGQDESMRSRIGLSRQRAEKAGCPIPGVEAVVRYGWIAGILDGVVHQSIDRAVSVSDRIDKVLTHRIWGSLVFLALMVIVFQSVFTWAGYFMDAIEVGMGAVQSWTAALLPAGALRSLLVDGVLGGVGGVLVFLPQIFILFFFIAILEDCGYMARTAYLVDKLMSRIGLSGKSFIPLLSSFACAVPGIMAARVIENRRDRLVTVLVAPLMSCSARLPVYTLLIAAFVPPRQYLGGWLGLQGITMFSMYLLGTVTAIAVALILKMTVLPGSAPPFVLELPSYKLPSIRLVLYRMLERGWAFVRRAGTLILAVSVVVWAAAYYPRNADQVERPFRTRINTLQTRIDRLQAAPGGDAASEATAGQLGRLQADLLETEHAMAGAYMRQSLLGRIGRWVEPAVRPLGWDWRIGCAAIASFPAREVVVSTLGVIYNLGDESDATSQALPSRLRTATWDDTGEPVYNVPVALSIMVFFALCAQCAATLAVMKRETNSWRWPLFAFGYMTALAYIGALLTYQIGSLFVS